MLFEQENQAYRRALNKAIEYLSLRDHSSGELYDKLCKKLEMQPEAAAAAIARCVELGLLDDEAFAHRRAKYLLARNKSPMQIRTHLQEKGIDRQTIGQVLEALFEEESPVEAVYQLLQKSYGRKLLAGKKQNVIAAMARRGFSFGDIKQAIARFEEENAVEQTGDEDWQLDWE